MNPVVNSIPLLSHNLSQLDCLFAGVKVIIDNGCLVRLSIEQFALACSQPTPELPSQTQRQDAGTTCPVSTVTQVLFNWEALDSRMSMLHLPAAYTLDLPSQTKRQDAGTHALSALSQNFMRLGG